jgi:quercetin dioxygenase-like cupin family protein
MSMVPVRRLLTAIVDLYRAEAASGGPAAVLLSAVLQAIAATPYPRSAMRDGQPAVRQELPVAALLADVEGDGPLDAVLTRLRAAAPHLDWLQDPAVIGSNKADMRLRDGYGAVEIVGHGRTFRSPSTAIGFWLLAPGLALPVQCHAAEQACHVVSGEAEWSLAGGDWRSLTAGSVIHHPPMTRYAVRTLTRPLLVLYCRRGDQGPAPDDEVEPLAAPSARRSRGSRRDA